jgi:4-amino-4-deoxy-L-arabinose transferase-like glycosyltransferase
VPRGRLTIRTAGAGRIVLPIAAAVTVVLLAFASGYGYHRDELYFVAAGRHLAWAYADQGPLTPLIARAMTELAPDSLVLLRVPSALAAGVTVLLTGLLARELGGGRRAQSIAAAVAAVAAVVLVTGHMLSTSTFDLLVWTAVTWLAVRALRTGQDRLWPVAGVVLGVGLLNKPLPAFLAAGLLAGVVLAGPRRLLRNPYVWAGAAIALVLWSPWIVWQADHGWPQLDVSRSIAAGGSASSQPWWAIVPFQFLLVSPPLAPVWIAGLVRLFADPALRRVRFLGWAWVVLAIVFMAVGGKPYYLAGLLPVLIAAGALAVDDWLTRGRLAARRAVVVAAVAAAALADAVIALPVLPADRAGPVIAANADVGETIGWPEFARTVAGVFHGLPDARGAVILTRNYGEAGAIDRYGPALGLPRAYSGHNAYGDWGPPPDGAAPVVAVGLDPAEVAAHLRGCRVGARIDNRAGVENDERAAAVMVCRGPRRPWSLEWQGLRHLG